jgi:hypothetical protein
VGRAVDREKSDVGAWPRKESDRLEKLVKFVEDGWG